MSETTETSSWKDALPEPLRDSPYIRAAETPEKAAQELQNAAQWQGNSIRVPGPDAGPEELQVFQEKALEKFKGLMPTPNRDDPEAVRSVLRQLGVPEAADKYSVPEGVSLSPDQLGNLQALAHKSDLTQVQFEEYVRNVSEMGQAETQQRQQQLTMEQTALKNEWGPEAYNQRVETVRDFLETNQATPDSVKQALEAGTLPAEQVRWLYSLAEAVSNEDSQVFQQGQDRTPVPTKDEAQAELNKIVQRMFHDKDKPIPEEMQRMNNRRVELMRILSQ